MDYINRLLGTPLGWIMWVCYQIVKNYGVALFIFTLITRAAMFPMTLKQQKGSAKMALIQPQTQELQKKYANNKEKLNEEMMKLYQKEGYNPMSGCLPLLIQLPILFGLIDVIYRPLKHILRLPNETIEIIEEKVGQLIAQGQMAASTAQIRAIQLIDQDPAPFASIGQEAIDKILGLNMNFFGINLGLNPEWSMFEDILSGQFNPLLLIPILSALSALASSLITMRNTASTTGPAAGGAAASMKGMMLMMPVMSLWIAFSVPAGVGLYWFYSNLIAIFQSLIMNKLYNPKEMAERAKKEMEEREEKERQERIEAKKQAKLAGKDDEKALSQKEINRRKLAEARKRDAERYGEVYVEVTDDDLN